MRDSVQQFVISESEERAAVQKYLIYLSMLVDVTVSGVACLAVHDNARAMWMLSRLLIEYVAKAEYCDKHPDFALWWLTTAEAEDFLRRIKGYGAEIAALEAAERALDASKAKYGDSPAFRKVRFSDMMTEIAGVETYTSIYRDPSIYIHGDPIGMREMFEAVPNGVVGKIDFSNKRVNGLLVDLAANMLSFCSVYANNFNEVQAAGIPDRLESLRFRLGQSIRKYPEDRDPAVLAELSESTPPQSG